MILNGVGYKYVHEKEFFMRRPMGSGDYLLLLVSTRAFFRLEEGEVVSEEQSFILYKKGTAQYYGSVEERYINDWVHFDLTEEEAERVEQMGIPFNRPIKCNDFLNLSNQVKKIYQETYSANPYKDKTILLYLELLLIKLAESLCENNPKNNVPHYQKFSSLRMELYNKPEINWTMEEMAKRTFLSASYFQHLYKQIFSVSPQNDLINARMERAQYLLTHTEYAVGLIARECGYKTEVHFMRQFKKLTGVTPQTYRKNNKLS